MHISEIKNKLKLDPPKFCCDKPLTKKDIDPFENRSFFCVFVGQPRSGKTSHMISALMSKKVYNKVFDHIYVVMPEASRKSLKNNPFKNLKNTYDELDYMTLKTIHEKIESGLETDDEDENFEKPNSLIIIDDQTVFLKVHAVAKLLTYLILNRRHLRLSIMMTVQYYNSIPLPIRKNISSIILANKPVNSSELKNITTELFAMDEKNSVDVLKYCFQKKYDKCHVILEPLTYYRNLNRLEISGTDAL